MTKHETGEISLDFIVRNGRTIAYQSYHRGVIKTLRPQYLADDRQVTYFLLNLGGGAVSGDRYLQNFNLQANTQVHLTTQSAMKIFTANGGLPASQKTRIALADGALLEYICDPLILYEGAKYNQVTTIDLTLTSHVFFVDSLTPGWDEQNQGLKYDEIDSKCHIFLNDKLAVMDRLRLKPKTADLNVLGRFEGYTHVASGWFITPKIKQLDLAAVIKSLEKKYNILLGLSELSISGFAFRVLAHTSQDLMLLIAELRANFRALVELPAIVENRKY